MQPRIRAKAPSRTGAGRFQSQKDRAVCQVGATNDVFDAVEDRRPYRMKEDFILVRKELP